MGKLKNFIDKANHGKTRTNQQHQKLDSKQPTMENPSTTTNGIVDSSVRTDYGSTSTNPATDTSLSEICALQQTSSRFSSHSSGGGEAVAGYQSLPYASSTNLFRKSPTASPRAHDSFVLLPSRQFSSRMSVDKKANSETRQTVERLEYLLGVVNQMCIGFVTIYMSWACLRTGLAGTALHAWLVTIGFSFLMAEAIMCHYSANLLTFTYKRTTKTTIHWVLQVLGGGCGVAGALIKCIQKGFILQSTHGKLGFSAFILCLVSMLSGLCALCSTRVKSVLSPLLNKTFHNLLGIATFAVALVAQYYGYQTGFFRRLVSTDFQILMKSVTLVSLVLTSIGPLKALCVKFCNIKKHFS